MSPDGWLHETTLLAELLRRTTFTGKGGLPLDADSGFALWRDHCRRLGRDAGQCFLIGNGASASMASHIAADLAKNALVHTQVFTDLSLMTCMGNDLGYDQVFAEPLRRRAKPGDMLVAISSSGNSINILNAVDVALDRGVTAVTLSAMSPANPLAAKGDLNIYVPASTYGHAESCHAAILHYWVDRVIES
jgi:D-sedoheptulose 7-phosphate isomerase